MPALFACRKIDFYDIMRCSFALTKTEHKILMHLLKSNSENSITAISKRLSLERSTVQKAVKTLLEKGLIERKQQNLSEGGFRFYYSSIPKKEIKNKLLNSVRDWHSSVERMIDKW